MACNRLRDLLYSTIAILAVGLAGCGADDSVLHAEADPVDLGQAWADYLLEGAVAVTNVTGETVHVTGARVDEGGMDGFALRSGGANVPATLDPGETFRQGVVFSSRDLGRFHGSITLLYTVGLGEEQARVIGLEATVADPGEDADHDGLSAAQGDCDDTDGSVYPGAQEVCDGVDRDCDGDPDDGCRSCADILGAGLSMGTGEYPIYPGQGHERFVVECEMELDGGGWTLVQRTTDSWVDSKDLRTDYRTFRDQTVGEPASAFRLAGAHWPELTSTGQVLVDILPRTDDRAPCDDSLRYRADGLALFAPVDGPAVLETVEQGVPIFDGFELSTTDAGPATGCVNEDDAVPWFLDACCSTCPTISVEDGWNKPVPAADYLHDEADEFGRRVEDVCAGSVDEHEGFVAATRMSIYLR